jgi:ABC-type branched-subunit amino acid transport system substrate-binding protein
MNFTRNFKVVLAVIALALFSWGSAFAQARGVTDDEIVIGTHLDLSGPAAAGMPPFVAGMEMAFNEVNEAGGIHGRKIRLVIEDNAYQPQQAVRATQSLIKKDKAFLIFSPFGTGTSAAGFALAAKEGVPHVFPLTGAPSLFHPEGSNGSFTYLVDYVWSTRVGLDWVIKKKGSQRVGLLIQDDAFGKTVQAGVLQALEANNIDIVETTTYKPGDVDFSAQLTKLKAADVDLVVLATVLRETIGAYVTIRKMGWDVDVLTAIPGRTQIGGILAKGGLDGLYGIGQWIIPGSSADTPEGKAWLKRLAAQHPQATPDTAMLAYTMAHWVIQALDAAGPNLSVDSFNAAMEGSTYLDIFGHPKLTMKNGHISPQFASVWQADNVTWKKVSGDFTE